VKHQHPSRVIRNVIGVEEMENLTTLQAVANQIIPDAVRSTPYRIQNYVAYLSEGTDVGGLDVGFLVKRPRSRC